jgi:squalene cyclase
MRDTPAAVEARYRAMLLARSGQERLRMAGSMYATARALVIASVLEAEPEASEADLRKAVFVRFYGHEFDEDARGRILTRLAAGSGVISPAARRSTGTASSWR